MAQKNLKKDDVVSKITFDMKYKGRAFKNVTLMYDYKLTWEECHFEDAETWNMVEITDTKGQSITIDFHIYGEDDSLSWLENHLWIDGVEMYQEDTNGNVWSHGDEWLADNGVKFSNVKIHTKDGKCERINIGK